MIAAIFQVMIKTKSVSKLPTIWGRPLSEYPITKDETGEYGPTVIVRIPPTELWTHGPTYFVAHWAGEEWVARDPAWPSDASPMHGEPDAWMPIDGISTLI